MSYIVEPVISARTREVGDLARAVSEGAFDEAQVLVETKL